MSFPDLTRATLEPYTTTETGDYYKFQGKSSNSRQEEWFLLKLWHCNIQEVQEIADTWTHINRYVSDTVPLVRTVPREQRLGMVFRYLPTKMYECLDRVQGRVDPEAQFLHCSEVARVVFDLHTKAEYVHTRLHPKVFYLDSDGKFKLGHLSKCQTMSPERSFAVLKAEDRYRVGLLLIYMLTNCPFDRLVLESSEQAMQAYDSATLPDSCRDLRAAIGTLLDRRASSDRDLETVFKTVLANIPKTIPKNSLQTVSFVPRLTRTPTGSQICSKCGKSAVPAYSQALPCSHPYCTTCVYNLCLPGTDITCIICGTPARIASVLESLPHADLRNELKAGCSREQ